MEIMVKKAEEGIVSKLNAKSWPTWESPVSEFDWHYDEQETCYFIKGKVKVEYEGGEVEIKEGDIAVFPKGLSVKWKVLEPVKKHYSFQKHDNVLK